MRRGTLGWKGLCLPPGLLTPAQAAFSLVIPDDHQWVRALSKTYYQSSLLFGALRVLLTIERVGDWFRADRPNNCH